MLKKYIHRDNIRRFLYKQYEIRLMALKFLINLKAIDLIQNHLLYIYYSIDNNIFTTRSNNSCIITGRQNGIYRKYKLSRIQLRDSTYRIYGIRKSS